MGDVSLEKTRRCATKSEPATEGSTLNASLTQSPELNVLLGFGILQSPTTHMATGPSKPPRKRERRRQQRRKHERRATRLERARPKKMDPALAAETIERIVPRRHLIIRSGDVLLERSTARGFVPLVRARDVYQLCVEGE